MGDTVSLIKETEALSAQLRAASNGHSVTEVTDVTLPMGDEGSAVLDDVEAFVARFVSYPHTHARTAHTLWLAHVHMMERWDSTPRLAALSPEPASGKTRVLEVSELLVPRPVEAVNVSAPYLFRKVADDDGLPTILFDEVDTIFGPKAREHEDVRGLLNAGHRKGAVAGRCVVRGKTVDTVEYPAYCALALAGLGDLPDTLLTRSVIIRMRRRAPHERIEPFRRRLEIKTGHALRDRLAAWGKRVVATSGEDCWPEMPAGVEDRDADVWEALLAVADAAGGDWPTRARAAAVAMVAESKDGTPSLGIRLLSDMRTVLGDNDAMHTKDVVSGLLELPESPWTEISNGKPLNASGLSARLRGYGIKSKPIRRGEKVERGYKRDDFADAWTRYLPEAKEKATDSPEEDLPSSPIEGVTSVTRVTSNGSTDEDPLASSDLFEALIDAEPAPPSCVKCGEPLPEGWGGGRFGGYCERHGGVGGEEGVL